MPSFLSHTIMASDVHKQIENKKVSFDYMITYSLGCDLSKFSKCRKDSHKIKQEEFIYNMCDYIMDNKLADDMVILGVLYGHICHYVMDKTMHPLVKRITKECIPNKRNHFYIENYIDNYLANEVCKIDVSKYTDNLVLTNRMNKDIKNMINSVYLKTYNVSNLMFFYKFNLFLYRKIKYLYRWFGFKLVNKMFGMEKFLSLNDKIDILNVHTNDEIIEYYNKSVSLASDYIKEVNNYLIKKNK